MDEDSPVRAGGLLEGLKQNAGWAIGIGLLMVIVGILSLGAPLVSGLAITIMIGTLLIIGGAGQCLLAFRAGAFGRGLLLFLLGLVTLVAGLYLVSRPAIGLASLTAFLAVYFVVTGILAIVASVGLRPAPQWGWMLANGIITLLLGLLIWQQWPLSGAWAIGVLVGVQLIVGGIALITIGSAVRRTVRHVTAAA